MRICERSSGACASMACAVYPSWMTAGVLVGIVTFDDVLQALLSDMQTLVESDIKAHRREQLARR